MNDGAEVQLSVGNRLSRQLARVTNVAALDLMPMDDLLRQLFGMNDEDAEIGLRDLKRDATNELRDVLANRRLIAYVEHPSDGRIYRIPACYWGSFHDYRPLASGRFCAAAEHGKLALQLHEGQVFVVRSMVDAIWPNGGAAAHWTCDKMEEWWTENGFTNSTKARDAFMKRSDTKGLTASFSECWSERHPGRARGRPPKAKSDNGDQPSSAR